MATDWNVISQRQEDELTPQGTFAPVMVVQFQHIDSGTVGSIKVPLRQYTEDYVRDQIDDFVSRIAGVAQL